MATIFVARSATLSDWGADVGLGKFLFKVGITESDPADLAAAGFAGLTDWTILKSQDAGDATEAEVLERLGKREKTVDPTYYPRIKGEAGLFKLTEQAVQRHMLLARALAGEDERKVGKPKPADFAAYLITNALR
ncbi:hypothetical protein [Oleisolibacter albus]|uniref:hypothetical protein n=1 Tax=Oleisolibacter albus TaxID=2171757 RepID=UPI000DF2F2B0|nr:hypothetical protein [Oleisolibacter albus]